MFTTKRTINDLLCDPCLKPINAIEYSCSRKHACHDIASKILLLKPSDSRCVQAVTTHTRRALSQSTIQSQLIAKLKQEIMAQKHDIDVARLCLKQT